MSSHAKMLNIKNSFSQESIQTVPETDLMSVVQYIKFANEAQQEWKSSNLADRIALLEAIIKNYLLFKNELIQTESWQQGLSYSFTEKANYQVGLDFLNQYLQELRSVSEETLQRHKSNGVMSVILSWNLSNRLFIESVIPAILAGNAILVKPSHNSLLTGVVWEKILSASNIRKNLVSFVYSSDQNLKKILVTHPGIKAVKAYGHLKTCSDILKETSQLSLQHFKKISLQSGSKNTAVAIDEPNPALTSEVLTSFYMGQGQLHWNSSRLFVLEKHEAAWMEVLQDSVNKTTCAISPEDNAIWTPGLNLNQSTSTELLEQIKSDQGKIVAIDSKTNYLNWIYHLSDCSVLQQDELSTPYYIFHPVKYPFDIPKYSNVSYYGAQASVWGLKPQSDSSGLVPAKWMMDLDVGLVSLNQWAVYKSIHNVLVKQSAFGSSDCRIFGDFNSNVKITT